MSHPRVRETSDGDIGIALLMGSSACSRRSFSFTAGFSGACVSCPPRARRRAPSTELGVTTAAPKANTTATTVTNITIAKIINGILIPVRSYLNLNNLADYKVSNGLQGNTDYQQSVSNRIIKERPDELRTEHGKNCHHGRRHPHEQGHGEAALRGVNPHLALNLEALADYVGQIVEDFSQVAAGFALQHDGGDEELHVHQGDALGEIHKGVAHRHAEFLLFVEFAEFAGQGFGGLVGNHFQSGGEGVAGTDGAGQSVDRLGEKFFDLFETLLAAIGDNGIG